MTVAPLDEAFALPIRPRYLPKAQERETLPRRRYLVGRVVLLLLFAAGALAADADPGAFPGIVMAPK